MLSSWRVRILGIVGIALLAVAGFGVYYFVFRDDPAPLTLKQIDTLTTPSASASAATSAASVTASAPSATAAPSLAAGTTAFKIDPAQSEAAYFAAEKLASLPTNSTAKGTTKAVSGAFYLKTDGLDTSNASTFTVKLSSLTSDQGMRDRRVQQTLETSKFPNATFTVTKLTGFPAQLPASGAGAAFTMTGMLEVHGVKKEVTWDVTALRNGATFSGLAKVSFKFADFGMAAPNIGGFVSVEDGLRLEVQIVATAAG